MNGYDSYDPYRGREPYAYATRDDFVRDNPYGKRIPADPGRVNEGPYGTRLPPRENYNSSNGHGPPPRDEVYSRGRERDMPPPRDGGPASELDHLATFTVGHQQGLVSPEDGIRKLRQMEMTTGIWTMRCELVIQSRDLIIVDKQTGEEMERFSLNLIKDPTAMTNTDRRDVYNNIVLFTVMEDPYRKSPTEMHIFQSIHRRADDVVIDIKQAIQGGGPRGHQMENHRTASYVMENQRAPPMIVDHHRTAYSYVENHRPPPVENQRQYSTEPRERPDYDRDRDRDERDRRYDDRYEARRDSYERENKSAADNKGVSNQIRQYEAYAQHAALATQDYQYPARTGGDMLRSTFQRDETESVFSERTDKDVQLLNHCFDDIEKFVERLQQAAEAFKELDRRRRGRPGSRGGGPGHGDGMLSMRSRPPPAKDFIDIFQKFKLSFNLLAKLRSHIHDPNAPELVHFLFTPLSLIVEASKDPVNSTPDLAQKVVAPLLTPEALDLLHNCLTTKERELLRSLGDPWNISAMQWKGYVPPYVPRFYDGWQPSPSMMDEGTGGGPSHIGQVVAERARDRQEVRDHEQDRVRRKEPDYNERRKEPDYNERDRREYETRDKYGDYSRGTRTDDTGNFTMYKPADDRPQEDPYSRGRQPPVEERNNDPYPPYSREPEPREPQQAFLSQLRAKGAKIVQVKHARAAKNDKELTVQNGEYLEVIDDGKNWWKLRNDRGDAGHAPYTILDQVR